MNFLIKFKSLLINLEDKIIFGTTLIYAYFIH